MVVLKPGVAAPVFRLKDQDGKIRELDSKTNLILYFYPKDFTPDCTRQLKDFTDEYFYIHRKGFDLYGVSPDDQESHTRFCEITKAPYPLLSDLDCSVAKAYGAWKAGSGYNTGVVRSTFVIKNGIIIQAHYDVHPVDDHAAMILKSI